MNNPDLKIDPTGDSFKFQQKLENKNKNPKITKIKPKLPNTKPKQIKKNIL